MESWCREKKGKVLTVGSDGFGGGSGGGSSGGERRNERLIENGDGYFDL